MKAFLLNKLWLVFALGLLIGSVIFFPTNQIKEKIFAIVSKNSGAQLQAESMSFGTGLGMGLSKGGFLALKFKKLRLQSEGFTLDCESATLSPHLLPLFVGQAAVGVACDSSTNGEVQAKLAVKPFWNPATLDLDTTFKSFNMGLLSASLPSFPMRGFLYGDLSIPEMPLGRRSLPPLSWKLTMQKVVLPSVSSDFVNLPEISLGTLDTRGSFKDNRLQMDPLILGNNESPLSGNLAIDFTFNAQMIPMEGEIKGTLRADPKWETSIKNTIDLGLMFGPGDATGSRKFRKPLKGNILSLFDPPLPY